MTEQNETLFMLHLGEEVHENLLRIIQYIYEIKVA